MSKKSLIALMVAAMLPDFSHSDLGIRYAMPTQGCWTQAHRRSEEHTSELQSLG